LNQTYQNAGKLRNHKQFQTRTPYSLYLSGHLFVDPITYNGLLLDASNPRAENRTLPNSCQLAIDIEITENAMFRKV
jgi:hypothetical protein